MSENVILGLALLAVSQAWLMCAMSVKGGDRLSCLLFSAAWLIVSALAYS